MATPAHALIQNEGNKTEPPGLDRPLHLRHWFHHCHISPLLGLWPAHYTTSRKTRLICSGAGVHLSVAVVRFAVEIVGPVQVIGHGVARQLGIA